MSYCVPGRGTTLAIQLLIMFAVALLLLLVGFPVAFTFGGVAVFFGLLAEGPEIFSLMPHRIWSIMNNTILMAIPLFIFMGIVLQKSNLAERLLESMGFLFGEVRGGIAISTILVGALLAAATGVVGASVVGAAVVTGGSVVTMDESLSLFVPGAVAVHDGAIEAVGSVDEISGAYAAGEIVEEYQFSDVLPGG